MRLWCLSFHDRDEGNRLSWHTSRRNAQRGLARARRSAKVVDSVADREMGDMRGHVRDLCDSFSIDPYEIPTTRAGLAAWLTVHFCSDNG